jgi:uncharacterized membrane protein YbhN (UPF0104 family)
VIREAFATLPAMNPALGLAAMTVMIAGKTGAKTLRSQRLLELECARVDVAAPPLGLTARLLAASHAAGQFAWGPLGFGVRTVGLKASGMPLAAIARVHVAERVAEAVGIVAVALVALAAAGHVVAAAVVAVLAGAFLVLRGKPFAIASGWAFVSSLADLAVLALASRAMHVDAGVVPLVLGFLAINAATCLPITPGGLGVQEAAITLAFATAGIAAPQALACALAYRCAHLVPLALVGVPALISTSLAARKVAA